MIASVLRLTRSDIKTLKITDAYSLHRVIYNLYEDIRTDAEKLCSLSSGILYADKGGDEKARTILMLSTRTPCYKGYGEIESKVIPTHFLSHEHYKFEVIINPTKRDKLTKKLVAIRGDEAIRQWFIDKASTSWGFDVNHQSLQIQNISVVSFKKNSHQITQGQTTLKGELTVLDRDRFTQSFHLGIGRGRAFGCGLLQIAPKSNFFNI